MAEAVPSKDEIMALANDILKFAVERMLQEMQYSPGATGYDQMKDHQRSSFGWIVEEFAHACSLAPDSPNEFEPLIDGAKKAENALTGGLELHVATVDANGRVVRDRDAADPGKVVDPFWAGVNGIQGKVGEWTGDAADNFRQNFLAYLSTVPANQSVACRALYLSMDATKRVYELYLIGLKELATKARAVLHPSACHHVDVHVLIKIAAGVTKMLAGFVTLEEGGAFVMAEGGMDLVEAFAEGGDEGKEYTITGVDPRDIMDSTSFILKQMESFLDQREQELIKFSNENSDALAGKDRPKYLVPRPSLVDVAKRPGIATNPNGTLWNEFD